MHQYFFILGEKGGHNARSSPVAERPPLERARNGTAPSSTTAALPTFYVPEPLSQRPPTRKLMKLHRVGALEKCAKKRVLFASKHAERRAEDKKLRRHGKVGDKRHLRLEIVGIFSNENLSLE